jgi:hypothetical protein
VLTGLLIVIVVAVAFAIYATGMIHGIKYTDNLWREWLGSKLKVAGQRSRVEGLYPEKNND